MLAAGLHPNALHVPHMRLKVLFSGGFTVRSPGSWLGGSWVSALVIISVVLHLRRDLAVMSGWLCFCFLQDLFNSPAHKLPSLTEHVHRYGVFLVSFVVCLFCFGLFVFFCFLCWSVSLLVTPAWTMWTAYYKGGPHCVSKKYADFRG